MTDERKQTFTNTFARHPTQKRPSLGDINSGESGFNPELCIKEPYPRCESKRNVGTLVLSPIRHAAKAG